MAPVTFQDQEVTGILRAKPSGNWCFGLVNIFTNDVVTRFTSLRILNRPDVKMLKRNAALKEHTMKTQTLVSHALCNLWMRCGSIACSKSASKLLMLRGGTL